MHHSLGKEQPRAQCFCGPVHQRIPRSGLFGDEALRRPGAVGHEVGAGEGTEILGNRGTAFDDAVDRRVDEAGQRHCAGIDNRFLRRPLRRERFAEPEIRDDERPATRRVGATPIENEAKAALGRRDGGLPVEALRQCRSRTCAGCSNGIGISVLAGFAQPIAGHVVA